MKMVSQGFSPISTKSPSSLRWKQILSFLAKGMRRLPRWCYPLRRMGSLAEPSMGELGLGSITLMGILRKVRFLLRAGVDLEILPSIFLDLNANYRFETWDFERAAEEIDTDVVTAGAIVRLEF